MTKAEIIQWVENYENPADNVSEFARQLVENIKKMNFTASNNGAAIGYAGSLNNQKKPETGLYKTADIISKQSGNNLCFINYSAENILNDPLFNKRLIEAVDDEDIAGEIIGGKWSKDTDGNWHRSKYSFPEMEIPALNDLVSENFMNTNARGNVILIIAENAAIDSVLPVTELPVLMNNANVESILGIPISKLWELQKAEGYEGVFLFLKEKSLAMQSDGIIYSWTNPETGKYEEIISLKGTAYDEYFNVEMPEGMEAQGTYSERLGDTVNLLTAKDIEAKYSFLTEYEFADDSVRKDVIESLKIAEYRAGKTSDYDVASHMNINVDSHGRICSSKIAGDLISHNGYKNLNVESVFDTNVKNILQYRDINNITTEYGIKVELTKLEKMMFQDIDARYRSDSTTVMSNIDLISKNSFLADCTQTDLNAYRAYEYLKLIGADDSTIRKTGILPDADLKAMHSFLAEGSEADLNAYRNCEYLKSIGASDDVIRKTGLMPDSDIKFKYDFLSDCTDSKILDRFRNYEYILANNIATTTADVMSEMNIYIDTNGKLISLVEASSTDIPTDFACKVTLGDASHFLLDDVMESTYSFYKDLSAPEKIKFKEYDYHTRYTKLHLDKINISDATMNKYLAAAGKTADSLNAGDRYFMKMADALTSGDVDTVKWINKLSDSCKGISTIANVFLNGVDALGTIAIASISINNAVKLYNAGYENEASAIMTGCAVDIIGGVAGGAAITGAISPYLVGFGAAIGGPAGAAIGAVVAGVVGYGAAGLASSKVGEFVTENWDAIIMTVEDVYGAVDEGVHDLYGLVLAGFDADADGAYFKGNSKDNFINAGEGNNKVDGFAGNDSLYGAGGDDTMYGGEGNDTVCGDSGKDVLYGEDGNDTLIGGTGADIMYGGKGNDTYVWGAGYGTDRIYDSSGLNKIIFDGLLPEDIRVQYVDAGVMVINDKTSEVLALPEFTLGSNYHNFELEFANGQKMSVDS